MSLDKLKQKLFSNPEVEKEYEKLKPEFEKTKANLKRNVNKDDNTLSRD